ncbi:hypothetical protein DPMN_041470 [Dreissena polymorpha]|uniref:Uncharacterized protein n=1 Tax=Dreissena polymorpha TaxID=45954 RepID=A0A9D4HTY3_DREPO|nr:hypothetical protein DPMN_041470 [Dreissena polymorpha]
MIVEAQLSPSVANLNIKPGRINRNTNSNLPRPNILQFRFKTIICGLQTNLFDEKMLLLMKMLLMMAMMTMMMIMVIMMMMMIVVVVVMMKKKMMMIMMMIMIW